MLFNTLDFFLFLFITLLTLSFGSKKFKKLSLLSISYIFYSFWDVRFLSLILISTVVDYFIGIKISKNNENKKRKFLLFFSLFVNLSILGFFKYFNFFAESFSSLFSIQNNYSLNIILPVGISFYTFQTISYTFDIYNKKLKPTTSFIDFANFVSFFPQLVAGPIERAKNIIPQLSNFNGITFKNLKISICLIFIGYIKKVLISDNIAPYVDYNFLNFQDLDSFFALSGLIFFSFQIYFDFSGYTDIARGIAKLFNIDLMINFKQPYFSKSPSDFWNRWHISLSTWLRDYLYIPLGGNRSGKVRTYINLMITMLLGGLWHGASWNFIVWGFLHGIYLIIYRFLFNGNHFIIPRISTSLNDFINIIFIYIIVLLTWIPFRSPDINTSIEFVSHIINWVGYIDKSELLIIIYLVIALLVIDLPSYLLKNELFLLKLPKWILNPIFVIGFILIFIFLLSNFNDPKPFVYFQF